MAWARLQVEAVGANADDPLQAGRHDGAATWGHDHCEFCWQEFSTDHDCADGSRPLTEGYTARGPAGRPDEQRRDNYHWVCPTCFDDFKEHFGWTIGD